MNINIDNINRQAWFAIAAMLVIYLILTLEDLVDAMRKRDVVILKVYEGGDMAQARVIENEPVEPLEIPPLRSAENETDNSSKK